MMNIVVYSSLCIGTSVLIKQDGFDANKNDSKMLIPGQQCNCHVNDLGSRKFKYISSLK